jgi:hypothetical protein
MRSAGLIHVLWCAPIHADSQKDSIFIPNGADSTSQRSGHVPFEQAHKLFLERFYPRVFLFTASPQDFHEKIIETKGLYGTPLSCAAHQSRTLKWFNSTAWGWASAFC